MKTLFVLVSCFFVSALGFSDYTATIADISGKVEIKNPGSSKWEKATLGMVIKSGTVVSVGLKSGALLKLGENSINVKSLTRLTLKDLVEKEGKLTTDLYLDAGKIHVEVAKIDGKKQDFKVGSPVATASVRGTEWDQDPYEFEGYGGEVQVVNENGDTAYVTQGESAAIDPFSFEGSISDALDFFFSDTSDGTDLSEFFNNIPDDLAGFFEDIPDPSDYVNGIYGSSTTLTVTIK